MRTDAKCKLTWAEAIARCRGCDFYACRFGECDAAMQKIDRVVVCPMEDRKEKDPK